MCVIAYTTLDLNTSFYVFTLIFGNNFSIFNVSKVCCDESCTGKLMPISPKGAKFVAKTVFCVHR